MTRREITYDLVLFIWLGGGSVFCHFYNYQMAGFLFLVQPGLTKFSMANFGLKLVLSLLDGTEEVE